MTTNTESEIDYQSQLDNYFLLTMFFLICAFSSISIIRFVEHQFEINNVVKEVLAEQNDRIIQLEKTILKFYDFFAKTEDKIYDLEQDILSKINTQ